MRRFLLSFILYICFTSSHSAWGLGIYEVSIKSDDSIPLNQSTTLSLDEIESLDFQESNLLFQWDFGDGSQAIGPEVHHSYEEPGVYEQKLVLVDKDGATYTFFHEVFVYKNSYLLLTDLNSNRTEIERFIKSAKDQYVQVDLIENFDQSSDFLADQKLEDLLFKNIELIQKNETLVVWTKTPTGLISLSHLQASMESESLFDNKSIIFISDENFRSLRNIAQVVYQSIHPAQILLTRSEAFWPLIESNGIDDYIRHLDERGIKFEWVSQNFELKPWNFMVYFINDMIEHGIPLNTLRLLLMLPLIVTVIAFMKQVVGLNTLGVYTPAILTLSFIALDLPYALLIFFIIIFFGSITRSILSRYRLLYVPRMAILLSVTSLMILLLLYFGSLFRVSSLTEIPIFPILILNTMAEKFIDIQSNQGFKSTLKIILEVLLVSVITYFIVEWDLLKNLILGYPELILLTLGINLLLARWTGLRLLEYVRFREVIRYTEEE